MAHTQEKELDPLFQHLSVPCVCDYQNFFSKDTSFLEIPERCGFRLDVAHHPERTGLNAESAPAFLQGWLFFSFLSKICDVFGVELIPTDLLHGPADGKQTLVSGQQLLKYAWLWYGANFTKDWDSQLKILDEFKSYLDIFNKVINAWVEQTHIAITPVFDRVLLSLVILGDALTYALSQFPQNDRVLKANLYKWRCPPSLQATLLQSGWCKGELRDLSQRCRPNILLYLSTLDRKFLRKNHQKCTEEVCYANQLNEDTYEQAHTQDCDRATCRKVIAPVENIKAVLQDGGIPVVRIAANQTHTTLEAQAHKLGDSDEKSEYVAMSHVWSDGMGNPKENALPECELKRVQRCVNQLSEQEDAAIQSNDYFWMDTLCVPLESEFRKLAIVRMAKTYFHASKVLMFDNWLRFDKAGLDPRTVLLKIAYSTWSTRLWTYQESILAQRRYVQYGNKAYTISELQEQIKAHSNLKEVSECLGTVESSYLLRNEGAMNLIKALTCPDPTGEKFTSYYASLPPQEDEDEEELRLQALQMQVKAAKRKILSDMWQPFLDESGLQSDNWYGEDWIRKHVEGMNPILDPVYGHAKLAAEALRGNLYSGFVSREEDSKAEEERRLTAFEAKPDFLFMDASRGLLGRMTSKLEDETVCLGGIIGLDVSQMLAIKSPKTSDPGELRKVREERMKIFLTEVKDFVPSILFWESERFGEHPWRWAPLSFLDRRACVHPYSNLSATITPDGLLGTWEGIRFSIDEKVHIEERHKTMRLEWARPIPYTEGSDAYHFHRSWEKLELRHSSQSWADLFSGHHVELGLIISTQSNLEGILVDIVRRDEERILHAHYLANIGRVKANDDRPEQLEFSVQAIRMGRAQWCVG